MILNSGFDSIFESLYLEKELTSKLKDGHIIINPVNDFYYDKHIIITMPTDISLIKKLSRFNTIESRIPLSIDKYDFKPYTIIDLPIKPFIDSKLVYNKDFYKSIKCIFFGEDLYVEKPIKVSDYEVHGYLTMLGFLNKFLEGVRTS